MSKLGPEQTSAAVTTTSASVAQLGAQGATGEVAPPQGTVSPGYLRYALVVLLIIYTLNFIDQQIVNILAEPIKRDLGLADWQLGAMTGFAFALFYCVLGVPIARVAERANRPFIIAACAGLWSMMTALCGLAQSFVQLLLLRIGVGVGEAGCAPTSMSLITDYAPREKRASAIAFFSLGTPLGFLLGMSTGGIVADAYGWRMAFVVAGSPGILMAVVAALTLIEPRKKFAQLVKSTTASAPAFSIVVKTLLSKKTFLLLAAAVTLRMFVSGGHAPFTASFFFRNHTVEIAELAAYFGLKETGFLGMALGLVGGTAGMVGVMAGGLMADWLGRRDRRAYVILPAVATLFTVPLYVAAVTVPTAIGAIFLLAGQAVVNALWFGPVHATVLSIVQPTMRATTAAILMLFVTLLGAGLGPLAVGAVSDIFAGPLGMGEAEGLRWSLVVTTAPAFLAAWLFWHARKSVREELVD